MSDGRFYTVCLLLFAGFVFATIMICNVFQPTGLDVQLVNLLMGSVAPIISSLLVLMGSKRKLDEQTNVIKNEVRDAKNEVSEKVESVTAPPKKS